MIDKPDGIDLGEEMMQIGINGVMEKYNVTRQTVNRWRVSIGLPPIKKTNVYSEYAGKMTDEEAAQIIGIRANTVTRYRIRHGIPPYSLGAERKLQSSFCDTLDRCEQYVKTPYGYIDVLTDDAIYECKDVLNTSAAHKAVGQLCIYGFAYTNRRRVIVCGKNELNKDIRKAISDMGIEILIHKQAT